MNQSLRYNRNEWRLNRIFDVLKDCAHSHVVAFVKIMWRKVNQFNSLGINAERLWKMKYSKSIFKETFACWTCIQWGLLNVPFVLNAVLKWIWNSNFIHVDSKCWCTYQSAYCIHLLCPCEILIVMIWHVKQNWCSYECNKPHIDKFFFIYM